MLLPIAIQHPEYLIHSFTAEELSNYQTLVQEVLEIRSNPKTLTFLPGKIVSDASQADCLLQNMLLNAYAGRGQTCFIRQSDTNQLIGMIEIIPPLVAREFYRLESYPYFIEFYLIEAKIGRSLMSQILPRVILSLNEQGIFSIGAVVNRANHAAQRVLLKCDFIFKESFDPFQDLYLNYRNA